MMSQDSFSQFISQNPSFYNVLRDDFEDDEIEEIFKLPKGVLGKSQLESSMLKDNSFRENIVFQDWLGEFSIIDELYHPIFSVEVGFEQFSYSSYLIVFPLDSSFVIIYRNEEGGGKIEVSEKLPNSLCLDLCKDELKYLDTLIDMTKGFEDYKSESSYYFWNLEHSWGFDFLDYSEELGSISKSELNYFREIEDIIKQLEN